MYSLQTNKYEIGEHHALLNIFKRAFYKLEILIYEKLKKQQNIERWKSFSMPMALKNFLLSLKHPQHSSCISKAIIHCFIHSSPFILAKRSFTVSASPQTWIPILRNCKCVLFQISECLVTIISCKNISPSARS